MPLTTPRVTVIGAGLAGCEAAWQLAERGVAVRLVEQKPVARTPAQTSDSLCELVCSNSMRGAALTNAVGLLKEELRRAGSLVMGCADATRVPAGGALAVDREAFSAAVTARIREHPRIALEAGLVERVPEASPSAPVVLATGPLTADGLAADLAAAVGLEHLAYYDAIAPIVASDSIDWAKVFKQSRYGKGTEAGDDEAYVNCPFDEPGYRAFVAEVLAAKKVEPRSFEEARYFEGCLPIEVMASRGEMTLAFGPMKPVGLVDPRTGRRPFAVVQLRPEDAAATAYNLVGFQTRMTWTEQARVLRGVPGLEQAEFLRFGSVHRNTFVDAPRVLDARMQLRARPGVFLAGQITGVEGYVESCASGLVCAVMLAQSLLGLPVCPPPPTCALGGVLTHTGRSGGGRAGQYQPSNVTWAWLPPPSDGRLHKRDRYDALARRALADLAGWLEGAPLALAGRAARGRGSAPAEDASAIS
ncbi:MAG TPA: methylenetetrahydrofolate--tRNA-(uracil(54)-C(5))-methyltransferase (FADH(2)-oxidizing) TrmFO [Polyangiaceae bacterium]|nr:methylenetetrahydrofolate--tRNA-(uracil(54)-C(5))-methyltransferase (FADH(2)-oxidizing) TrmFO [Polyangiaceae bacterium]